MLKEIKVPEKYKPSYRVLEFDAVLTPDLQYILAGYDKHIILIETSSGKVVHSIEATKSRIISLHISPSGEYAITTNGRNNQITAWKVESLKTKARSYQPLSMSNSARYMCTSRNGSTAIVRSMNSSEFAVVDIETGQKRCEISSEYEAMVPFVTQDGKYAVLREYNSENCLKVWDTYNGSLVTSLPVSSLNLKGYVLGNKPENMAIFTESESTGTHMLSFCSLPSGKENGIKVPFSKYNMLQIFFAKNDQYLIVGIEEQLYPGVKIYSKSFDVRTGSEIQTYERMHPKHIQLITPESECFLGQHIHTDKHGTESWETLVLNIETGDSVVTLQENPSSTLHIGWQGRYGIDKDRSVFDIKKGVKCCQFDKHLGEQKKSVPKPRLTNDEKFAIWLDAELGLLKVGNVEKHEIVGITPVHSIPMNLEVTPEKIILIGCEDGRIMMLQMILDENEKHKMFSRVFLRTSRKALKAHESSLKAIAKHYVEEEERTVAMATGVKRETETSCTCNLS